MTAGSRPIQVALMLAVLAPAWAASPAPAEPARGEAAWLGVLVRDAVDGGVGVIAVVPGGPAAAADLRCGDVIIEAGEEALATAEDLSRVMRRFAPGQVVTLRVLREEGTIVRGVTLGSRAGRPAVVLPPPPPSLPEAVAEDFAPAALEAPALGVSLADVTPDLRLHFGAPRDRGLLVTAVSPRLPADRAGLRVGDIVVALDERPLEELGDVASVLPPSGQVLLTVVRGGTPRTVSLALSEAPAPGVEARARELARRIEELHAELARLEGELARLRGAH